MALLEPGRRAPAFSVPNQDGVPVSLAELRGQVVLVHTWGYYCGPCVKKGVPYVVDLIEAISTSDSGEPSMPTIWRKQRS